MATLDVSDIIDDPEFSDSFLVTRHVQNVDNYGRSEDEPPAPRPVRGSVQPMSGRSLNMMPDMVNVSGAIEIFTRYRLEGPSDNTHADVVTWQGRNYVVMNVQSYNNYGLGYVHAVCQMLELVAKAPNRNVIDSGP